MSRKSFILAIGTLLLLGGGLGAGLVFLVRHEPGFYHQVDQPPGEERAQLASKFLGELAEFYSNIYATDEERQPSQFTDESINSYLAENFVNDGMSDKVLPHGISGPRVVIEKDKIRLAFRYGMGPWNTIVSIDMRVWLVTKEPNLVALELQSMHAGSLPISAQSLLERVYETARQQDIDVTWYRYNGNPVALLRFQANQRTPTVQLQKLELHQGKIVISAKAIEPAPLRAMLPESDLKAQAQ